MKDNPKIKVYNPTWSQEEEETIDTGKIEALKGNPFLYNPLTSPYIINSIEDYRIKYKKDFQSFGSLVRNATFSRRKRRKIAKKAFIAWDKDVKKAQETRVVESMSVVETSSDIGIKKFSGKMIAFLIFSLLLMVFIICISNGFFTYTFGGEFFQRMRVIIVSGFENYSWIKIVMDSSIYVIIITLIYSSFYNMVLKDFQKSNSYAQELLEKSTRILDKEYEKKIKKAEKYYLSSVMKKNYTFAPYSMTQVCECKVNKQSIEKISQTVIDKSKKFKSNKFIYVMTKNILIIVSFIIIFGIVSYVLYEVVKNLIF